MDSLIENQNHIENLFSGYCKMPLLWSGNFNGLNQFTLPALCKLPQKHSIVLGNSRLGILAESLFCEWISELGQHAIIIKNYQVISNKQTIGELDIILQELTTKLYYHIELVTKFYIYNPNFEPDSINAWIGPNKNDSLKNKIEKLKLKQLPLIQHQVVNDYLSTIELSPEDILQQVCFKAWLFIPLNVNLKMEQFNNECIAGYYVTFDQFLSLHTLNTTYFCPTKQDWLRYPETQKQWFCLDDCLFKIQEFMARNQSIMVWTQYKLQLKRYIIIPFQNF